MNPHVHMRRYLVLGVVTGVCFMSSIESGRAVDWTGTWEAPALPNSSVPVWIYHRGGSLTQTEYLNIESDVRDTTASFSISSKTGNWLPSDQGATVEFEVRVNTMTGTIGSAVVASGFGPEHKRSYVVSIGPDWVQLGKARVSIEPTMINLFRLVADGDSASLYINNETSPVLTTSDSLDSEKISLSFGDPAGYGGGNTDWKSLKWTDQGGFPPVGQ